MNNILADAIARIESENPMPMWKHRWLKNWPKQWDRCSGQWHKTWMKHWPKNWNRS